ncbi:E3 ubiquitin-protein ligase RNF25 [Protopterus annectens]|uniref:E3 ubiquitin-protein ligase RNF25 n=1 Tax=Protopterus annectens TaxID=7888 RepID=UPI001CFA5063|nr:E3 ubiquitin-protein ligase RNF25 [Protopterus annectens]
MATSVDNGELSDMEGVLSELEVLQSIYVDELVVSYKDNRSEPWEISLTLHPATAEDQNSQYVRFTLLLSLSSQYPDAAPRITIQNPRGLSDEQIQHIRNSLTSVADAGIGGPVLYEIIEKGKEILTSNNVPYCQCVICLYGFQENEAFTKTECYHYFHSNCLARYIQHTEEELEMERMENERNKIPPPQQEPGVPCPVCRTTLAYDLPSLLSASPPQLPSESYIPDGATLKRMEELQLIFKRQQAKGGIIDPEAEKNRYLIRLQETAVGDSSDESSTGQLSALSTDNPKDSSLMGLPPAVTVESQETTCDGPAALPKVKKDSVSEQYSAPVEPEHSSKDRGASVKQRFRGHPDPSRRHFRDPPEGLRISYRQHDGWYRRGPREFTRSLEDRDWASKRSGKYKPEFSRPNFRSEPDETRRFSPVQRTQQPQVAGQVQSELMQNGCVQLPDHHKSTTDATGPVEVKEKAGTEVTAVYRDSRRGRSWGGTRPRREWDSGRWEKPKDRESGSYPRTPRNRGMGRPLQNENKSQLEVDGETFVREETR